MQISAKKKQDVTGMLAQKVKKDFFRNKYIYLLFLPVAVYFILFHYKPIYGIVIAFKQFSPAKGINGSPWVGMQNFTRFFEDFYFGRLIRNTFVISLYSVIWGFPVPILFALLLNELSAVKFKKVVQTCSYLPHFISLVIVCSMIKQFSGTNGLFNNIIASFGGERMPILQLPEYFRTVYITSDIWQDFGWNSIIYLAALSGVDPELYEAAKIAG